ncbi:hypothetical protein CSOJ01_15165 [Colletotrichum sojae]|uniref:Uncharacterized protein n=1 Tax=Colletotrichum sojae TaxID=2175907 RepID=A0A8H6MJ24_9PEZI|nr:hypothetical protein CSOJ01_15165 [Colletotrichum sojae]
MSSTASYHAINAGGAEPPAEAGRESAIRSLNSEDDTERERTPVELSDSHASRRLVSLATGEDHDALEATTLDSGFLDHESAVLKILSWAWDIILTVLPLLFIVLAILAAKLDGSPVATSEYGGRVVEITRLGPTIYPILFAMVAARFYKNAARYRLERPRGMKMSSLEQVFGSQSFSSALERLFVVRAQLLLGALILSTWAMSPLGGQSSSRLLRTQERRIESRHPIYYDDRAFKPSVWGETTDYTISASDIVQALYSGLFLSPKTQQRAFSDVWGRPKIPQLPRNWRHGENSEAWRLIDSDALREGREEFTSLIGVNIQSPDFSDNTTRYDFEVQSTYFNLECKMIADAVTIVDLRHIIYWKPGFGTPSQKTDLRQAIPSDGASGSFVPILTYPTCNSSTPYLLYTSSSPATRGRYYSVFNCTMAKFRLETKMRCTVQGCSPQEQRQVLNSTEDSEMSRDLLGGFFQYQVQNALDAWPSMTKIVPWRASATENFIANDKNVYANQAFRNWTGVDEDMFSSRLTTAFNMAWEAGIDPYSVMKGSSLIEQTSSAAESWTNETLALVTRTDDVYYVNVAWASILIFATTVLQILAIGGLVLRCLIRGPDILGFASALTRDNRYVPVNGGSSLDGADRAKCLGDMRVRIADVQPQESCGYVAFSVLPNGDGNKEGEVPFRPLEKKRLYR